MARPKNAEFVDVSIKHNLTIGLIERFICEENKPQQFLRDNKTEGLAVRATPSGAKSYIFEAKLDRKTIRVTIGSVKAWTIEQARNEANRLRVLIDGGIDPREADKEKAEARAAKQALKAAKQTTVGQAWADYMKDRKPFWGEKHYNDHLKMVKRGGEKYKRGKGTTIDMPLVPLLDMRLSNLDSQTLEKWIQQEKLTRPALTERAHRLLKIFLTWCAEQEQYKAIMPDTNPADAKRVKELFKDVEHEKKVTLQREQLAAYFREVKRYPNHIVSAYLQTLLLTGARPSEIATMRWERVNLDLGDAWIRDKDNAKGKGADMDKGKRHIPLPRYLCDLLKTLPKCNQYVFPASINLSMDDVNVRRRERKALAAGRKPSPKAIKPIGNTGHIVNAINAQRTICSRAGITPYVTLQGLRGSFATLSEWVETPIGIAAQIQGHKPSATRERNYINRPIDLLRIWHEKITAFILESAEVPYTVEPTKPRLQVVKTA